jgi:hypothetical protein
MNPANNTVILVSSGHYVCQYVIVISKAVIVFVNRARARARQSSFTIG